VKVDYKKFPQKAANGPGVFGKERRTELACSVLAL